MVKFIPKIGKKCYYINVFGDGSVIITYQIRSAACRWAIAEDNSFRTKKEATIAANKIKAILKNS